jgi:hypothetical protein
MKSMYDVFYAPSKTQICTAHLRRLPSSIPQSTFWDTISQLGVSRSPALRSLAFWIGHSHARHWMCMPSWAWSDMTALMTKMAELHFPEWTGKHERAFTTIKNLVISLQCLTTIDHDNPGENKIFITCDASDYATGAVLSWGPT